VAQITDADVDIDRLVRATQLFTPADIDFAARKAAQAAFERAVLQDAPPESGQQLDSAAQPSMNSFALSPRPGRR
jgi:SpoVK/Ycf46/Vps4 family AAA+-type ATPase